MAEIMKEITASEVERHMREYSIELEKLYNQLDSPAKRIAYSMAVNNFTAKGLYLKSATAIDHEDGR